MSGHSLKCRQCRRPFTAKRADAGYCSRACRRHASMSSKQDSSQPAPPPVDRSAQPLIASEELEGGWRRLPGGLIAPPADPRLTVCLDPNDLRRL